MHKADNNPRARVTNGMAERNSATADVDLTRVDGEQLLSGLDDDRKRLIDFEQRDVFLCQTCLF